MKSENRSPRRAQPSSPSDASDDPTRQRVSITRSGRTGENLPSPGRPRRPPTSSEDADDGSPSRWPSLSLDQRHLGHPHPFRRAGVALLAVPRISGRRPQQAESGTGARPRADALRTISLPPVPSPGRRAGPAVRYGGNRRIGSLPATSHSLDGDRRSSESSRPDAIRERLTIVPLPAGGSSRPDDLSTASTSSRSTADRKPNPRPSPSVRWPSLLHGMGMAYRCSRRKRRPAAGRPREVHRRVKSPWRSPSEV